MSGWKIEARKRINLPEDIADGLWIETPHPKMLPYEPMKLLMDMAPDSKDESNFDMEKGMKLASALILAWNLTDPSEESGKVLDIPAKDESVWQKIPAMPVIKEIFGALGEGIPASEPDPNS